MVRLAPLGANLCACMRKKKTTMQTPVQVLYSDSRCHKHQNLASSPTEVGRVALGGPKSIKCLRGSVKKYSLTSAAPLSGTTGAPPSSPPQILASEAHYISALLFFHRLSLFA